MKWINDEFWLITTLGLAAFLAAGCGTDQRPVLVASVGLHWLTDSGVITPIGGTNGSDGGTFSPSPTPTPDAISGGGSGTVSGSLDTSSGTTSGSPISTDSSMSSGNTSIAAGGTTPSDSGTLSTGSGSGSDTGSTSGGTTLSGAPGSSGTDASGGTGSGGSCSGSDVPEPSPSPMLSCKNEVFRVKLNPLCPSAKRSSGAFVFDRAYHPILSAEARIPMDPLSINPRSQQQPYHSSVGPASYASEQERPTILMASYNLLAEDWFGPNFGHEVMLDYSKLAVLRGSGNFPAGWGKVLITIYVCDDTNGDGKCSDEALSEQITLRSPVFQACHFPSAVPVDVWKCAK